MNKLACVVLAAGDGKRMKSVKPKVLMEVLMKPMLGWVLDSTERLGVDEIGVIVGNGAAMTEKYLKSRKNSYRIFHQTVRKGTGHAVMQAQKLIEESENLLVLCGDAPFIDENTLKRALEQHISGGYGVTVITASPDNPTGYGRIVRGTDGDIEKIVEEKDATPEEKAITEINSGAYWFNCKALLEALPQLSDNNASGELYLTDTLDIIRRSGKKTGACIAEHKAIVLGANTRSDLYNLNYFARMAVIGDLLEKGVEFPCTDGVIISADAEIGQDTVILPGTIIKGRCRIGCGCVIGPNSLLENVTVGDGCRLNNVQAYDSVLESDVKIGPFVHIRPGTHLARGVKIGDFVEVKNSNIGEKTAIAHLTYVGDSDVGKGVNFGCGCVTANYDGIEKFRTKIGDYAFLGCNTNLIAPVEIGENAATGAGSTITKNVPANGLAVERAETVIKESWEKNFKRIKKV